MASNKTLSLKNTMPLKKIAGTKPPVADPAKKMKKISDLILKVQELGFQIRREKLKQGHGWRCMSGDCLLKGEKILFLDSKMSLDEQIHFLSSWLAGGNTQAQAAA